MGVMFEVVCIGECMLELARAGGGWRLAHGGDTLNTALYMRRLGVPGIGCRLIQ
jgi:hypothetical protein